MKWRTASQGIFKPLVYAFLSVFPVETAVRLLGEYLNLI
jgi:hypothetical protein